MKKAIIIIIHIIAAIGAINWGLVGIFDFDIVAKIFGAMSAISRVIYVLIGISGIIMLVCAYKCGACKDKMQCNT